MKYRDILITGGAGFIGSNLAVSFKRKYPTLRVTALDNLKRRGSQLTLPRLKAEKVDFIHADIRCPEDLMFSSPVDLIIECSAEPSVLAGYSDNPAYIIRTNLSGAVNCFELARRRRADMVFLSTSRVYPYEALDALERRSDPERFVWKTPMRRVGVSARGINEEFPTSGAKTLYGATKHACEEILIEYLHAYGLRGVINRCGVVAGPWQFGRVDQGVFTYWMLAHYFKKRLRYIGYGGRGRQVRDLLHVDDLFDLIDRQVNRLTRINGRIYNAGGGRQQSLSLREATQLCRRITGNRVPVGSSLRNRPGDIAVYYTDNTRVSRDCGWRPVRGTERILADIHEWIRAHEADIHWV
ncbi:MAG: NAD-dependent epimerase/dehydratase family protein [Candidatus Omnitrophica bacterium]|nr:NAD-dependent epimerase/dehydratase family protein [Candidatus Omnitrophota bacterium]